MQGRSFRFIHTSGFQLASTLQGIAEPPEHLRSLLVEAPFRAVENVVEAALREEVEFLVLSGDILEPATAGPAAVAFLQQKFAQLQARKISVYWAASKVDVAGELVFRLELPANVHIFPSDRVETMSHFRGDYPVATLTGRSWNAQRPVRAAEFSREGQEGCQIAVLYARGDLQPTAHQGIHYWALGGSTAALDLFAGKQEIARCPGAPQGFGIGDSGPHSCTLVSVDGEGEIRTRTIETDAVRWLSESLPMSEGATLRDVRNAMKVQAERLVSAAQRPLLVDWILTGPGRFDSPLVRCRARDELLEWLRSEFGQHSLPLWSVTLAMEPPEVIPTDWCDDDAVLGDFMRAIRGHLEPAATLPDLSGYVSKLALPRDLMDALSFSDPAVVTATLREAAVLGADVLRGDDAAGRNAAYHTLQAEGERG